MFKEILRIDVQLEPSDVNKMEATLGARFAKIAKKFGGGLISILKGGGILGAVTAIADKLLNPLKEVQEAIDKSLHTADSLQDEAARFNTTAGELAKLHAFGQSKGLQSTEVNDLIGKFQVAVAEATADPTKNHSVKNFIGNKDTGQAFLTFLENLSQLAKTNPNDAIRVQQEVFGTKQIGKSGNFLQANFQELDKKFAGIKTEDLTAAADKGAKLQEIAQTGDALRDLKDIVKKSEIINGDMVNSLQEQKQFALDRENRKIENSKGLFALQTAVDDGIALLETQGLPLIGQLISKIESVANTLGLISRLRGLRGLLPGGKGK